MAKVDVNPGICGLKTQLKMTADDMQTVQVEIQSECPHIRAMQDELTEVDGYEECFSKYSGSAVYKVAEKHCKHIACPVPAAILKGIEVACGLALPSDVSIRIEK